MILTVWRMTYAYLVPGSGASACTWAFANLKDTMQSAEHLEREQAGATGWGQERGGGDAPWSVFPLESVWEGPFPEVGGYGEEGSPGGVELPNYFALFLSWRTKVTIDAACPSFCI